MTGAEFHYPQHTRPDAERDRCASVDGGLRCQLLVHEVDHHIACTVFDVKRTPVTEYRTWGADVAQPREGGLAWAPTFPRAE